MGTYAQDPMPVECPSCHAQSDQRRADLYALRARCPACGGSLEVIGQHLRAFADSLGTALLGVEILFEMGNRYGIEIEDDQIAKHFGELKQSETTLREIVAFFERFWPSRFWHAGEARGAVLDTARYVLQRTKSRRPDLADLESPDLDDSALDKPLLDALYPNWWARLENKE